MPQFNLPRKKVTMIQMWASVVLIALALVFSLTPMITLKSVDNAKEIAEMADEIGLNVWDIPDEVDVSAVKLVSSVSLIVNVFSASVPGEEGYTEDQLAKQEELDEYMKTEDGKADIATAVCIAATIAKALDFESMMSGNADPIGIILKVLVTFIALFSTLILMVVIPIILAVNLAVSLIKAYKNAANPEDAAAAVANKLPGKLSLVLVFMLMQCVIPGMTQAWGVTALCMVMIFSVLLNFVASRLREYPAKQFVYLNVLQGGALVGIVGFLVFFFNLLNTGVFNSFVTGSYFTSLIGDVASKLGVENAETDMGLVIAGILMVVYLCVVLGCAGYLDKAARRLSCTVKREAPGGLVGKLFTPKARDNNVVMAVVTLAAYIIPTYVAGIESEVTKKSILLLSEEQQSALGAALVGIIVMIAAEVAVIVLKKTLCKDLTENEAEDLMMGVAMSSDEILADAQRIVADSAAKAEEPAEEDVSAEEAPVAEEESVVDETTAAEETSTEEKQEAAAE